MSQPKTVLIRTTLRKGESAILPVGAILRGAKVKGGRGKRGDGGRVTLVWEVPVGTRIVIDKQDGAMAR